MIKVQKGKSYRSKDGTIIGPMEVYVVGGYHWMGKDRNGVLWCYLDDGTWPASDGLGSGLELIAEWPSPSHTVESVTTEIDPTDTRISLTKSGHKCHCEWMLVLREGCKCGGM